MNRGDPKRCATCTRQYVILTELSGVWCSRASSSWTRQSGSCRKRRTIRTMRYELSPSRRSNLERIGTSRPRNDLDPRARGRGMSTIRCLRGLVREAIPPTPSPQPTLSPGYAGSALAGTASAQCGGRGCHPSYYRARPRALYSAAGGDRCDACRDLPCVGRSRQLASGGDRAAGAGRRRGADRRARHRRELRRLHHGGRALPDAAPFPFSPGIETAGIVARCGPP